MKIREGAYYRSRGGQVFGPMVPGKFCDEYPWRLAQDLSELCWTDDGRWSASSEGLFDLVAEVHVKDVPQVNTTKIARRKCVNAHDRCYGGDGGPCDYCEIVEETQ
ncbi:hypothetical protein UFOVP1414_25 [uncultured Caudovirales phage]|uniref:Uncharacterized protein n=1 Tax=uncultured Caudovirales phage TaxID=2100421 RepID=A0A6J5MC09_9CAUD|nr:hypothetical protein UFOVP442_52 [uncultured Caudovirales phage]CAB4211810.1 hypothetical protein UFOVP1414_25 [uncultured Caudovirales phage]